MKKELKKMPTEKQLIDAIEAYRELLFNSDRISVTKFGHMQTALHGCKNIIRDYFGSPRKGDVAWVK